MRRAVVRCPCYYYPCFSHFNFWRARMIFWFLFLSRKHTETHQKTAMWVLNTTITNGKMTNGCYADFFLSKSTWSNYATLYPSLKKSLKMFKTNFFFTAIICCLLYRVAQAQIKTNYRGEHATVRNPARSFHISGGSSHLHTHSICFSLRYKFYVTARTCRRTLRETEGAT